MKLDRRTRWLALYVVCIGRPDDRARRDDRERRAALDQRRLGFSEASLAWVVNATR